MASGKLSETLNWYSSCKIASLMILRSSRILLEVLAGLLFVLVLLGAGAAWRLSQGPVSLAFAIPYVDEQLVKAGGPFAIELVDIILIWGGWDRTLDIRVVGVTARDRGGGVIAAIPEVSVGLAAVALAGGKISLTRFELIEPLMRAHRTESGEFELVIGERTGPTGNTLPMLFQALLNPHERESPLAVLNQISVVGGKLVVDDRMLRTTWRARGVDIVLTRNEAGLSARFGLEATLEGQSPTLSGTANYNTGEGTIVVDGAVKGVRPDRLATQISALARFQGLALPIDAEFEIRMTADGILRSGSYGVSAGAGALNVPNLVPRTIPVRSATARGTFDLATSRIIIDEAMLDLGGPTIGLKAVVTRANGVVSVNGETVVRNVPVDDLKNYWPKKGNLALREWITGNMEGGRFAEVRASAQVQSTRSGEWSLELAAANMRIEGVTVHYLKPLIPVRKVGASVTVSPGRVDVAIDGGDLNGLAVDTGTIEFTDDGADNWNLALDVELRGPARNALQILDHPEFGYASGLGLDVSQAAGQSTIRMRVGFPLLADLELDQVDIHAAAKLVDVEIPGGIFGHDVRDGVLDLQLDRAGMTVSGTATLAQIPATIEWYENFDDDVPIVRRYDIEAILDDDARLRLGLGTAPYLTGPVKADVAMIKRSDATSELIGRFALDQATIALGQFGWSKPAEIAGEARFEIDIADERIAAVRQFDIQAADLAVQGAITFNADGKTIQRAEIQHFSIGERTELSGTLARRGDGGFDISISGAALDGEALVKAAAKAEEGTTKLAPIDIEARFDRLWIGADSKIDDIKINAEYDAAEWPLVTATGMLSGNGRIEARYREINRDQSLAVNSDDAGSLLRALGVANNITGGRLVLEASKSGRGEAVPWRGKLATTNFWVAKAPVLARLLSLASLTGISNLVTGKGIHFSRLDIPFAMKSKRLTISNARAVGSQIGISAEGAIDLEGDGTRLEGTVVPAYTLNRLLGRIPILGGILTGGEGGGVFAVDYSLSGPLDKPNIQVNPLSALAPGILRNLLRGLTKSRTDRDPSPTREIRE